MFSDKAFQITFLISLITHTVILYYNPQYNFLPSHKKEQKMQLAYLKPPQEQPKKELKTGVTAKEPFLDLTSKIALGRKAPPPFIDRKTGNLAPEKRLISPKRQEVFIKPMVTKTDIIAIKKRISLPPLDAGKIDNPSYINYYQMIREKIKRAAYRNYTRTETGEVYISFIISSPGELKEARLVEEKSSFSPYLREVALRSIKEAAPFPSFPKELNYPWLSFKVVISFEVD